MRILLVDDEESIRVALEFLLKRAGHQVTLARTGEEAMKALARERFDLLILDLVLPGLDGFAVLERVKALPQRPRVLVLTARGREADRAKALALGAEAFMLKPFSTQELLAVVERGVRG